MQVDFCRTSPGCEFDRRRYLVFVAVYSARRQQAHNVHGAICSQGFIYGLCIGGVVIEAAIGNGLVYSRDALEDNPAGTQAHMAHFRVAHLPSGEAHIQP